MIFTRSSVRTGLRPRLTSYAGWTTAQLQKRRLDLYGMTPLARTPNEVPAYIYHGQALPQQDEIKVIEAELNRRYQAGDKSAELRDLIAQAHFLIQLELELAVEAKQVKKEKLSRSYFAS